MPTPSASVWNGLEIAKLIASVITPIVVSILGFLIYKSTRRIESRQWLNQKVVEKRLSSYEDLAPQLNDLLCYFTFIGRWKDPTPVAVVELKRTLDRRAYIAAPLFSPKFIKAYDEFMRCCFQTYTGWGSDAKLRTDPSRRREAFGRSWQPEWENCFSQDCGPPEIIRAKYQKMMSVFQSEFGVEFDSTVPIGKPPINWRRRTRAAHAGRED